VKALLSILLGLMLLTSLLGISYATPTVQPAQSTGGNTNTCAQMSPSNPNYAADNCFMHDGGNGGSHDPPHHSCVDRISPDGCCGAGITPNSLQVFDNQNIQIIQADTFNCGG
jgi:hypothetical protein